MMISPEDYYEEYLKGKTVAQIMTVICDLKNEISHLISTMEHPDYGIEPIMHPSENVRLWYARMYLERAKEALAEAGGTYTPSQAEINAAAFDERITSIAKLVLTIDEVISSRETKTITINGDGVNMTREVGFLPISVEQVPEEIWSFTKEELFDRIRDLHIGEWRSYYDPSRFGYMVMDGTQWKLNIGFGDKQKPITIYGDNAYPYNFDKLKELFGIDPYDEEDEE